MQWIFAVGGTLQEGGMGEFRKVRAQGTEVKSTASAFHCGAEKCKVCILIRIN
jgi:hypothetical protein